MKKKGELTTQQIVMIIILIVSFVVILFFIFRLNLGETSDKEICHNSVAMKAQSKLVSGPLDCKINYVCISGGGKCEGMNPTVTIKVNLNKNNLEVKNQVMKALANEMADCWWMFGEGKIDYAGFSAGNAITGNVACSLCSIVGFDEKIQNNNALKKGINYEEFYNYLGLTEKETGKSYLYYLYGTQNVAEVKKVIQIDSQESIDFAEQYSIITGIGKLGALKATVNWFASGFDAFNSIFSFDKIVGKASADSLWKIPVTIKEKSKINDLKCSEFLTKA